MNISSWTHHSGTNEVEPMDTTPPLMNYFKMDHTHQPQSIQFICNDTLATNSGATAYSVVGSALDRKVWEFETKCKITKLACGEEQTLILTDSGAVYSFGTNEYGQLGHADRSACNVPKRLEFFDILAAENMVKDITCGSWHSIALTAEGDLYTWGCNEFGQLGLDLPAGQDIFVTRPKMVKSLASKRVVQVTAGHSHTLVLTNSGEIYSFGSNSNGQLGLGIAKGLCLTKPRLIEMFTGFPAALIEAGGFHSFALSISGSVFGFGKNSSGQLGVGKDGEGDKVQPTQLATLRSLGVRYIAAGQEHTTFLTHDGGVFTCGNGEVGQLGHNSFSNEVLPRKILEFGQPVYQIACGTYHTLCLTKDKLYSFGRLGRIIAGNNKNSPMHSYAMTQPVELIFAGGDKSFALNGSVRVNNLQLDSDECPSPIDYRQYSQSTQIAAITDEVISLICSAMQPVDQDVLTRSELIFSSPSIWNSSFLLKDNQHIPSTYKNMGVDLVEADTVLSKLQNIKSNHLRELIDQMIVKDLLPKLPHQLMHVEILRVYVLLPLLPNFQTGTNSILPVLFAERLQSLKDKLSQVILGWMYDSPLYQLQRLISIYKRTIIIIIESNQSQISKDRSLRICLKFLTEFHSMNRNTNRLSHHTFAIPSLASKVDIREDYVKWIQYRGSKDRVLFFCDYPFVFDAQAKTLLLQTDQILQMNIAMNMAASQIIPTLLTFGPEIAQQVQYLTLHINRSRLVPDTLEYLHHLKNTDLKKPLRIKFIGEEAEDAGGVKKEFFLLLIREILNPQYGMFKVFDESRLIWFITDCFEDRMMYTMIGILCGLAIYNFIIVNLPFPLALYKKLLNEKVDLQDLKELNPTVGRSLEQLMEYTGDDIEEVFGLNFEINEDVFGTVKTIPLKPDGSSIPVNQQNKAEFVELYISHIFNTSVQLPFEAFKDGFKRVCEGSVLPLFYAQELQAMVTGNEDYDWGELESNCTYKGGYNENDPTIKMFWEVFHELSLQEKKQFLLFLTGSDRVPILGMKALKISIQDMTDEKFLPSAHTCFNLLDLPRYQTKERLRYKLLQAIQHNEGFSLV